MINENKEIAYSANCDICSDQFEHSFEGWTTWWDKDQMTERMSDQDWHFGDGEHGETDKVYCPKCYHIDDDDMFHFKPKDTNNE